MSEQYRCREGKYVMEDDPHIHWESFVHTISYKPGWDFEIENRVEFGAKLLAISYRAQDNRSTERRTITVYEKFALPNQGTSLRKSLAENLVLNLVRRLEDHETRESLLFDGVRVFDPHK